MLKAHQSGIVLYLIQGFNPLWFFPLWILSSRFLPHNIGTLIAQQDLRTTLASGLYFVLAKDMDNDELLQSLNSETNILTDELVWFVLSGDLLNCQRSSGCLKW